MWHMQAGYGERPRSSLRPKSWAQAPACAASLCGALTGLMGSYLLQVNIHGGCKQRRAARGVTKDSTVNGLCIRHSVCLGLCVGQPANPFPLFSSVPRVCLPHQITNGATNL